MYPTLYQVKLRPLALWAQIPCRLADHTRMGMRSLVNALPRLAGLPDELWERRHRGIVVVLWLHVPALAAYGLLDGRSVTHMLIDLSPLVVMALLASWRGLSHRSRACVASLGLMTASAMLVHLAHGAVQAHFLFFAMLPVVGLYLDWLPFALSVGFVVFHHAVVGVISPDQVFGQGKHTLPDTLGRVAVHAFFVVVEIIALLVSWRQAELHANVLEAKNAALDTRNDELDGIVARLDASVRDRETTLARYGELSGSAAETAAAVLAGVDRLVAQTSASARAAEEQHSAIEDVARAAADVRADAARAAEDALAVAAGAEDSQRLTAEGGEAVAAMVTRMREAGSRVETVAADVRGLAELVRRAGEITVAVRELAERSNLLALNASIEAARAGEHGRGFAVVADEVRSLAEESREATARIDAILAEIAGSAAEAADAATAGARTVEDGVAVADRATDAIELLQAAGETSATAARDIAGAAERQHAGMDRITAAITQAGATSSSLAGAASEAQEVADRLREAASRLGGLTAHDVPGELEAVELDAASAAEAAEASGELPTAA
jgi:methyl-accepting chemotaxis protein